MNKGKSIRAPEYKNTKILLACVLLTCIFSCQVFANIKPADLKKDSALQIYLPREVVIKESTIRLGQVSIIRGEDSLLAKAGEIALGRISMPGQKVIIDRFMVLSRLACNGIPASTVTLTGAEKITVKRQEQIIKGSELVELARTFLKENPPADSISQLTPVQVPNDFVLPETSKDIKLVPCLIKNSTTNLAKVQLAVFENGKQTDEHEVTFRLKYNCRKAVTLVDIPAGAVINPENTKIENTVSNYPESDKWRPPYGLIAKHRLQKNTIIHPNTVSPAKPTFIVKRNQNIIIRVAKPGLLVTAVGRTMQDGRAGEYIKVRNIDSQQIILAKINEDGTVEPIF